MVREKTITNKKFEIIDLIVDGVIACLGVLLSLLHFQYNSPIKYIVMAIDVVFICVLVSDLLIKKI